MTHSRPLFRSAAQSALDERSGAEPWLLLPPFFRSRADEWAWCAGFLEPDSLRELRPLRWRCVSRYPFVALAAMHSGVACRAQRDQVFFGVVAGVAAKLFVMDF